MLPDPFISRSIRSPHIARTCPSRCLAIRGRRRAISTPSRIERLPKPPSFNERNISDKPGFLRRSPFTKEVIGKIRDRYRDRLASLLAVDELVARLVAALDDGGELENTVVVFTSDNGFLQGEHRFHRGKRELWEESVRVPMMVRGPGFRAGNGRAPEHCEHRPGPDDPERPPGPNTPATRSTAVLCSRWPLIAPGRGIA